MILMELVLGALIGLVISTTGVGGGVIVLPILIYFFDLNALAAVATANFLSMLMKISSSYVHFRLGNIPLKGSMMVLAMMLPSTFLASFFVAWLGGLTGYEKTVEWSINLLMVTAIIFSLYLFIKQIFFTHPIKKSLVQTYQLKHMIVPAILAGAVLGATGVGGGVVVLPLLLRYMQLNIKQSIGTSIFVTAVLSGSSALAFTQNGYTDIKLALVLCAGALIAIPAAKYFLIHLSQTTLQYITLLLIATSSVMMMLNLLIF